MRQKNDGKGRLGGRQKGTPNKTTKKFRDWLLDLIDSQREQIEVDLENLDPKDRLLIIEKFMSYCVPKRKDEEEQVTKPSTFIQDSIRQLNKYEEEQKKNFLY